MALRQCDKCGEMVEEAKAFCPGCGNAFVVETKREMASNFDTFEGTLKLGDTMYNQMLSDMGLNISKAPDAGEKRAEVISLEPAIVQPAENIAEKPKLPGYIKWLIIAGAVILFLAVLVVLIAAVVIFVVGSR